MSTSRVVKRVRLGDDVPAYCGKCKEERNHQVVALNSGRGIERVTCQTCQGTHLYRERRAKTGASRSSTSQTGARETALPAGPVHAYSPQETYTKGQLVQHPKFGTGEVLEVRAAKIDVSFGKEVRTLLHAG